MEMYEQSRIERKKKRKKSLPRKDEKQIELRDWATVAKNDLVCR